jgi:hypothetical protein
MNFSHEQPNNNSGENLSDEAQNQERLEKTKKGREGFAESYEVALKFRNFERGLGEYENKENQSFSVLLFSVCEQCRDLAVDAIKENQIVDSRSLEKAVKQLELAKEMFVRFEEAEKLPRAFSLKFSINNLQESMKNGEPIKILESASGLGGFYRGFTEANEVLLANADKASGAYNLMTKIPGGQP